MKIKWQKYNKGNVLCMKQMNEMNSVSKLSHFTSKGNLHVTGLCRMKKEQNVLHGKLI